jgi:hypothetical protein
MRTTVELPPDLMRAAKARAAEQGLSLKEFFSRAVSAELGRQALYVREGAAARAVTGHQRVRLPIIASKRPGKVRLTNADLADIEAADDLEKHRRTWR